MMRARRCGLVAAQAGWADAATAMACSTSACLASATLAWTSPVLGSKMSPKRPELPLASLPPTKWPISRIGSLPEKGPADAVPSLWHNSPAPEGGGAAGIVTGRVSRKNATLRGVAPFCLLPDLLSDAADLPLE